MKEKTQLSFTQFRILDEARCLLNEIDMLSDSSRADFPEGGTYCQDMVTDAVPIGLLLDKFIERHRTKPTALGKEE